jgi:hypothetical protein
VPNRSKSTRSITQRGSASHVIAGLMAVTVVSAMALTFTPLSSTQTRSQTSHGPTGRAEVPSIGTAATGEVDISYLTPGPTDTAAGAYRRTEPDMSAFVTQVPLRIDHSVLNDPNTLPAQNPAPMAVAAYD